MRNQVGVAEEGWHRESIRGTMGGEVKEAVSDRYSPELKRRNE